MNEEYVKVVLDKNANILDFECTIPDNYYKKEEVIGKNWFSDFIDTPDFDNVMQSFPQLFQNNLKGWKKHSNDILCKDGTHRFIDFENNITTYKGEKVIVSVGREHYKN